MELVRSGSTVRRRRILRHMAYGLLALCSVPLAVPASAQTAPDSAAASTPPPSQSPVEHSGNILTSIKDAGIVPFLNFETESAWNPVGGVREGTAYTQQIDFGFHADLGKLIGLSDTVFNFRLSDRRGQSLSANTLGSLFSVQQIYGAGENFRLAQMNISHNFLDGRLHFKIGWSPLGSDFQSNSGCPFQNNMFCGHANVLTQNSGAHNFPTGQWNAQLKGNLRKNLSIAIGIYQDNPNAGDSDKGFDLSFKGTGIIVPVEIVWRPDIIGRPGDFEAKAGAYYNSSNAPDVYLDRNGQPAGITRAPFLERDGREGGYVQILSKVNRETGNSARGLTLFGIIAVADAETARYGHAWAIGANYQGTFVGRDDDYVAVILGQAALNGRRTAYQRDLIATGSNTTVAQTSETIAEVDYNLQLARRFAIRPNLQYLFRPGGGGNIPAALVLGLDTSLSF